MTAVDFFDVVIVGLPDGISIAATIPLGRPMGNHGPVRRRPLGEIVFEDGWDQAAPWAVDPPGTRYAGGPASPSGASSDSTRTSTPS